MTGERHELEIVVDKQGRVTVEVKGAKGAACLEYEELFASTIGRVKRQRLTDEYYEPPTDVHLAESERAKTKRGPALE